MINVKNTDKADKDFAKRLDFQDIQFPVNIRDIHKIKKRIPSALALLVMKIRKNVQSMYQKNVARKTCWLIIDRRKRKKHYVLINEFNRFMYDHSLHCGEKHFCCYCLHAFIREEILKHHIKDSFKINGKQMIKMPKKGEYVKFKFKLIKFLKEK